VKVFVVNIYSLEYTEANQRKTHLYSTQRSPRNWTAHYTQTYNRILQHNKLHIVAGALSFCTTALFQAFLALALPLQFL